MKRLVLLLVVLVACEGDKPTTPRAAPSPSRSVDPAPPPEPRSAEGDKLVEAAETGLRYLEVDIAMSVMNSELDLFLEHGGEGRKDSAVKSIRELALSVERAKGASNEQMAAAAKSLDTKVLTDMAKQIETSCSDVTARPCFELRSVLLKPRKGIQAALKVIEAAPPPPEAAGLPPGAGQAISAFLANVGGLKVDFGPAYEYLRKEDRKLLRALKSAEGLEAQLSAAFAAFDQEKAPWKRRLTAYQVFGSSADVMLGLTPKQRELAKSMDYRDALRAPMAVDLGFESLKLTRGRRTTLSGKAESGASSVRMTLTLLDGEGAELGSKSIERRPRDMEPFNFELSLEAKLPSDGDWRLEVDTK